MESDVIENKILFRSEDYNLEGLLYLREGKKGAVITHPHPLYGGTMHNQVVEVLVAVYQAKGFSTIRFNFRGAGASEGVHGQGVGEQEDVRAALRYLYDLGKNELALSGYSFGAWVNAKIEATASLVSSASMVSPPVNFLDFSFLSLNPRIRTVVTGGSDDIAPADKIKKLIPVWNPEADFHIVEGADHFYSGKIHALKSMLSRSIQ